MIKSPLLNYSLSKKKVNFRKTAPKYIREWRIENKNGFNLEQPRSSCDQQHLRLAKRAKIIRKIKFPEDLIDQNPLPVSHFIKPFKKYISQVTASSLIRRRLLFLKHLHLKTLSIRLNSLSDWRIFLFNKTVQNLEIAFDQKSIRARSFPADRPNPLEQKQKWTPSKSLKMKLDQLLRHTKSVPNLSTIILKGEYGPLLLKILQSFENNIHTFLHFQSLNLMVSYDDNQSHHLIEETEKMRIWAYLSHYSLKLPSSLSLLKSYLTPTPNLRNLRQIEICSLFIMEKDFSIFESLASMSNLVDFKISVFGLNQIQSFIDLLSLFHLPESIEGFSLAVYNSNPWRFGSSDQESTIPYVGFQKLKEQWKKLVLLKKIQLKMNLQFESSHVGFFGEFFGNFKLLRELELQLCNQNTLNTDESKKENPPSEKFDLTELFRVLGESGITLEKFSLTATQITTSEITNNQANDVKNLKNLILKSSIPFDSCFLRFLKTLSQKIENLEFDELVIRSSEEFKRAVEGLLCFKMIRSLKLAFDLDRSIRSSEVVSGIRRIIKHFKQADEITLFLNNYALGYQNFLKVKNEMQKNINEPKPVMGKISDFKCNLYWSGRECQIYNSQLDFFGRFY